MESLTRFDVFRFLVQHQCARAASAMWLDYFARLLDRKDSKPGGSAGELCDQPALITLDLEQMFEWLTALAFHHNSSSTEPIGAEVIAVGDAVRNDITHECIKLICERNPIGEWPPGYRELLMKLWGDGFGNLLSRTIREVRDELHA
jgi:hypothetical protein